MTGESAISGSLETLHQTGVTGHETPQGFLIGVETTSIRVASGDSFNPSDSDVQPERHPARPACNPLVQGGFFGIVAFGIFGLGRSGLGAAGLGAGSSMLGFAVLLLGLGILFLLLMLLMNNHQHEREREEELPIANPLLSQRSQAPPPIPQVHRAVTPQQQHQEPVEDISDANTSPAVPYEREDLPAFIPR